MTPGTSAPKTTRRSFLDMILGAAVFGWAASILYPIIGYLRPLPNSGPTGPARLTRDEVAALERNNFVIVPANGKRVMVFLSGDGQLRALDARCTHEGCTVQYNSNDEVVWCACHNALFDTDGRVHRRMAWAEFRNGIPAALTAPEEAVPGETGDATDDTANLGEWNRETETPGIDL